MGTDLPIRCRCGAVRGVARDVAPDRVNRVVCHCTGCRNAAYVLGREGDLFDEHGGTHRFQLSPAHLTFTEGRPNIGLLRLTPKGGLRWYAECCNTPLALTLASRGVFVAVELVCVDAADLETHLGPVHARVNGQFPAAQRAALKATFLDLLRMLWRLSPMLLRWRWRGDHRRSPFFDADTGAPIREPRALPASTA